VTQFATLTVLNCRLSTSDIERITKEEGQLVCLQTLRRLVDVFDHLVRQHDCHKVMRSQGPGLTRELETPLRSNSPHDHMILRVELVGSHGRGKRPCLQTAHMTI
jgi:hypothetical protein